VDSFGIHILTNDEVLAVDQSGRHGHVVYEGATLCLKGSLKTCSVADVDRESVRKDLVAEGFHGFPATQ
jgi:hypothetical protein